MVLTQVLELDLGDRVLAGFGLSALFFGVVLAFVYTFWGGPEVVMNEGYQLYDSMLFSTAFLLSIPLAGLMYFFTRDVSLSLTPVVGAAFSLFSGFEDLMVYVFCTVRQTGTCMDVSGLPGTWPWLEGHYVGYVSRFLGFDTVTDLSLVLAVVIGFVVAVVFVKILEGFEAGFLGVEL